MEGRSAVIPAVCCALLAAAWTASPAQQAAAKKPPASKSASTRKTAKTAAPKKKRARRPVISAKLRRASLEQVHENLASPWAFDNPAALVPFFERLYRMKAESPAVHVLHYGDSHTASDDWASVLRQAFQQRFGDGGPGFLLPGKPFSSYRRYDAVSVSTRHWTTEGTMRNRGDELQGLAGISVTATRKGERASVIAAGDQAELFYLQQPGGGVIEVWVDGLHEGDIPTDGEPAPARASLAITPGGHRFEFRTKSSAPVRLFGLVVQNVAGVTWETLGINGAQAHIVNDWNEAILAAQVAHRDPAMILLAYGTNEANTRKWDAAAYEAALRRVLTRFRKLAPAATLLLVSPPDARLRGNLAQLIEVQRKLAVEMNCVYWDWRARMGGPGAIRTWVNAGMAQWDHIHMTRPGYQLAGQALYADLMHQFGEFLRVRTETENVEARKGN